MQSARFLLFPFAVLYDGVTRLRNIAFDYGILKQKSYDTPIIAVGNLSTGGTGKTPMIEYLIEKNHGKRIAVLSRGYGRSTRGYREVMISDSATKVGDEPLQFKNKFGDTVIVAVCEKRVDGIGKLLAAHHIDLILLDDAYQHRYVKASEYILLTSYDKPYFKDYILPAGNLRESRSSASRANSIVVTKCPEDIVQAALASFRTQINPTHEQHVYFATISYAGYMVNAFNKVALTELNKSVVTVVTGIAKPAPFLKYLKKFAAIVHVEFKDHHVFTSSELAVIGMESLVITTEKDFMRLKPHGFKNVYYVPIQTAFLGDKL
jgi:tetraacyldisaccharide 4'-kinase